MLPPQNPRTRAIAAQKEKGKYWKLQSWASRAQPRFLHGAHGERELDDNGGEGRGLEGRAKVKAERFHGSRRRGYFGNQEVHGP
ncbi:hypothetical protein AXF42_Ash005310 [Apostasia shenzhenica]|uniref:Uncharacterized protein n=1 Tax=Apostasia shenzhenica TaxID=1088818 RepID=A0A2I0B6K7_9ASPA|nr:hypothetical protein AXF42_Ash005310 [Apostasia shenzhenica]